MNLKMKIVLGILASVALAALVGTGLYLWFGLQVLDRTGMINTDAPMLELLNAEWMSEDGVWSARIEDYTLDLSYKQDLVYSGNFFFGFDGDDLNVKTELQFHDKHFEKEDGSSSGTIESLYVENCRMYLDIIVIKEGGDNMRQQAVLDRAECGKPAESESEKIRVVSETAELVEFFWYQNGMSYDGCFRFRINSIGQDHSDPRLYCSYTDQENHERIEVGDEWNSEVCPPVPLERWEELADLLREAKLSAYRAPPPGLMDATDSKIQVTWRDGSEKFTNSYGWGTSAYDLLKLLQDIAEEVYCKSE